MAGKKSPPKITGLRTLEIYQDDIPPDLDFGDMVAIDTETMGLNPHRDRLCLVQLSGGDGHCHIVHFPQKKYDAPNLVKLLENPSVTKLFHFARFDIATLKKYLGVATAPVYCTKIASKLVRTYTDRHGLKNLCDELLGVDISKQQQSSDWGASELKSAQMTYAAGDVLYLHQLREKLEEMLIREGRKELAEACFAFLPTRAELDLKGWPEEDIFSH